MAVNFKILFHQNGENLHLKLTGDFDGPAALDLIDALKKIEIMPQKIVIDTSRLASIDHFGLYVFQKYCVVCNLSGSLTFTGEHSNLMALSESDLF